VPIRPAPFILLTLFAAAPALAQEHPRLGFEIGTTRYGSVAHDDATPRDDLSPDRPTMFTVRFTSHLGVVGVGMSVSRSLMDFSSTNGTGAAYVTHDAASIWEISPELRFAVIRSRSGAALHLHAGIVIDKWQIKEFEDRDRDRMGLIFGATGTANLGGGWDVDLRGDMVRSSSPFDPNEAGSGVTLDPVRRKRLSVGMARRF
jgi:hypothetical protein